MLPLVTLYLVWQVPDGAALTAPFLGYELALVRGDALSRLFATVFAIMAFAGGLFALNQNRVVELAAAFCYAGSAIGVVFAGDLITRLHLLGADGDRFDAGGMERGRLRAAAPGCDMPRSISSAACC